MKTIDRTMLVCGNDGDLLAAFCEYLNDGEPIVTIAGVTFDPADVLRTMDPIAFRLYYDEWVAELGDEVPGGRWECARCGYRWGDVYDAEDCCVEDKEN